MKLDELLDLMTALKEKGEAFCVVTVVRTEDATSAKAGAKALVTGDGALHGFVGGGCVSGAVRRAAAEAFAEGRARLIRVKPKEAVTSAVDTDGVRLYKSSCPSGGTVDLFVDPVPAPRQWIVCGASPVAAALVTLGRAMGYRTIVASLAADHRDIAGADEYVGEFDLSSRVIGPSDAIIVATQGKRDLEALRAALATDAGYIAMVGSRKKAAALCARLTGSGIPKDAFTRVHMPAGLDIGAIGPEEIALSILGEFVAHLRRAHTETAAAIA